MYADLDVFANELLLSLPTYKTQITESLGASEYFSSHEYRDLYDFAKEVSARVPVSSLQAAANALMSSLTASITANFAGEWHPDAYGLSIFLPASSSSMMLSYEALDMSVDLMWDDFLREFTLTLPDDYEPDDTYLEANQIIPGETQVHTIDGWGTDVDWVTFTLTDVTQVRITTSGPWDVGDSVLRLYNLSGIPDWPIAENDDNNYSYWSQITAWLGPGVYWVEGSAYDHEADIPYYELTLTYGPFPNEPPYAQFYWYGSPYVGSYLYFEGGISYDSDGYIVSYYWDFGDGSYAYDPWVYHMYMWAGDFLVTLTVTDDQGDSSSYSVWITIYGGNLAPVPV